MTVTPDNKPKGKDSNNRLNEFLDLQKRINTVGLSNEAKAEAERELKRLESMSAYSSEYDMSYNYLDWLAALPWNKLTGGTIDVQYARKVLDEDHYDLDKIKDRIMEYLAVKKLREERHSANKTYCLDVTSQVPNPSAQPTVPDPTANIRVETPTDVAAREPILCFVGPPGVGKTSLGYSIAHALGRKFVRISLGGLRDESEIRGHRRNTLGALPGRIVQSIKKAGVMDPVLMLDEIDKLGSDWRGDPASALLEVLDPAQNNNFVDHYLAVNFDLSQVLFIATANTLYDIPEALLDRMEILWLSGYSDDEKVHIAQKYLIPKQRIAHGLKEDEVQIDVDSIRHIIRNYTREAGVRSLDREIATVCRKVARKIAEGSKEKIAISPSMIKGYLGNVQYFNETVERTSRPGIATGLAWTSTGGDILFIEATIMPSGSERLILTGMMGDVMRESAQTALSYVRSNLKNLGIKPDALDDKALHIHIPAGSIPKDGPSAGITIATALVSLMTGRPIKSHLAMTGEITLRGQILPVGGIKEKVLAAHRAGVTTIIMPKHNEHDLDDVPAALREKLTFIFVDSLYMVLDHALEEKYEELVKDRKWYEVC